VSTGRRRLAVDLFDDRLNRKRALKSLAKEVEKLGHSFDNDFNSVAGVRDRPG
jgi:hypothetical protein